MCARMLTMLTPPQKMEMEDDLPNYKQTVLKNSTTQLLQATQQPKNEKQINLNWL